MHAYVYAQAMKGAIIEKPNKVYVVSRRGGAAKSKNGGTGAVKLVDARMKADKRGEKKSSNKRSTGTAKKSHKRMRSRR